MTTRRLLLFGLGTATMVATACGSVQTKTVTVSAPAQTPAQTTPVRPPSPDSTESTGTSSKPKARSSAIKPTRSAYTWCDANVRAKTATTTCPFAENVFVAYWTGQNYDGYVTSAYSPAVGRNFAVDCTANQGRIRCTAGDGSEVRFPQSAVDDYTLSQAKRYVARADVGDNIFPWEHAGTDGPSDETPTPSYSAPDTTSTPSVPDTSSTPPGENIPNYDSGNGFRVQCADGTYSHSGGIQGACSHHGGVG